MSVSKQTLKEIKQEIKCIKRIIKGAEERNDDPMFIVSQKSYLNYLKQLRNQAKKELK